MKLKIISGNNYIELAAEVNEFLQTVNVKMVKVTESYDFNLDYGFTSYHIFYEDQK